MNAPDIHREHRSAFQHEAFFYTDSEQYVTGLARFVQRAHAVAAAVLIAVPKDRLTLLRQALAAYGGPIRYVRMDEAGRNPTHIIPGVLRHFVDDHPGQPAFIVGEPIWPGRTPAQYAAAVQHEALINLAFAEYDTTILCPYDQAGLDDRAVADAHRTHPTLRDTTRAWNSTDYVEPSTLAWQYGPVGEPPAAATTLSFDVGNLHTVRAAAASYARRIPGISPYRIAELQLAVHEVATNSVQHGGGHGLLRVWHTEQSVLCEITDDGELTNHLAGRVPPKPVASTGRGLLLASSLCDLLELGRTHKGTTIRIHIDREHP